MLTSAEITNHIEVLSKQYIQLLMAINNQLKTDGFTALQPGNITEELVSFDSVEKQRLTIRQINNNFKTIIDRYRLNMNSTLIKEPACPIEQAQLMDYVLLHISTISEGFSNEILNKKPALKSSTSLFDPAINFLTYPLLQTYINLEAIAHAENITGNSASLVFAALATWQGVMLGGMLSASLFFPPLFAAVCGGFLAAGAAFKIASWLEKYISSSLETDSALASDHRFFLSVKDQAHLLGMNRNYDLFMVSEALRECAIAFNALEKTQSTFWHTPKIEILEKVRQLKSGYKDAQFILNGKTFELIAQPAFEQSNRLAVTAQEEPPEVVAYQVNGY